MGFEEIFVFVMVGWVVSYHQRSQQGTNNQTSIFILWMLAVVLPSLAIAWTVLTRTALPLIFVAVVFLLCVWIYGNLITSASSNTEVINLEPNEEKQLKDCFSSSIYQLKDLEYRPQEIYCRGNLRSQNPKYAYASISQNIQKIFGDRFVCYLQESSPENLGTSFGNIQNAQENTTSYSFYLRPNHLSKFQSELDDRKSWIASAISIIFTSVTVLAVGANIYKLEDLSLFNLQRGIPYFLGVASILIARAITQYFITKHHRLRFPLPFLLPCLGGFGLLGSLNNNNNNFNNFNNNFAIDTNPTGQRSLLFDLAVIPTIVGLVISIILLLLGNWVLVSVLPPIDPAIAPSLLIKNLLTFDSKNSIFVTLLQTILPIGKSGITSDTIFAFSPLTLAGWSGLALSAVQLMPFDLLDGGNLAIAMFGHRQVVNIARIVRLLLLAIALLTQPWLRIYSLLLFLLPTPSPLILNESIAIDKKRDLIGMILIAIALLIILPLPKSSLL